MSAELEKKKKKLKHHVSIAGLEQKEPSVSSAEDPEFSDILIKDFAETAHKETVKSKVKSPKKKKKSNDENTNLESQKDTNLGGCSSLLRFKVMQQGESEPGQGSVQEDSKKSKKKEKLHKKNQLQTSDASADQDPKTETNEEQGKEEVPNADNNSPVKRKKKHKKHKHDMDQGSEHILHAKDAGEPKKEVNAFNEDVALQKMGETGEVVTAKNTVKSKKRKHIEDNVTQEIAQVEVKDASDSSISSKKHAKQMEESDSPQGNKTKKEKKKKKMDNDRGEGDFGSVEKNIKTKDAQLSKGNDNTKPVQKGSELPSRGTTESKDDDKQFAKKKTENTAIEIENAENSKQAETNTEDIKVKKKKKKKKMDGDGGDGNLGSVEDSVKTKDAQLSKDNDNTESAQKGLELPSTDASESKDDDNKQFAKKKNTEIENAESSKQTEPNTEEVKMKKKKKRKHEETLDDATEIVDKHSTLATKKKKTLEENSADQSDQVSKKKKRKHEETLAAQNVEEHSTLTTKKEESPKDESDEVPKKKKKKDPVGKENAQTEEVPKKKKKKHVTGEEGNKNHHEDPATSPKELITVDDISDAEADDVTSGPTISVPTSVAKDKTKKKKEKHQSTKNISKVKSTESSKAAEKKQDDDHQTLKKKSKKKKKKKTKEKKDAAVNTTVNIENIDAKSESVPANKSEDETSPSASPLQHNESAIQSPLFSMSKTKKEKLKELIEKHKAKSDESSAKTESTQQHPKQSQSNLLWEKSWKKLNEARFRFLNEMMYTHTGQEAKKMFESDPDAYKVYQQGYQSQVKKWPVNPVDVIIKDLESMSTSLIIVDMGCGDAKIAEHFPDRVVHSFDLVATTKNVIACDMSHVPLANNSVDIVVFCLSLMGTNLSDYVSEAHRILKKGGLLKICEVESRFEGVDQFVKTIRSFGFTLCKKNLSHTMFVFLDFKKAKIQSKVEKSSLKSLTLKPCLYKKR